MDAVTLWPPILREVMSAKKLVQPGEGNRKIHIYGFLLNPVMPMMKTRCHQPAIKPLEPPANVKSRSQNRPASCPETIPSHDCHQKWESLFAKQSQHPLRCHGVHARAEIKSGEMKKQRCRKAERIDPIHEATMTSDACPPVLRSEVAFDG